MCYVRGHRINYVKNAAQRHNVPLCRLDNFAATQSIVLVLCEIVLCENVFFQKRLWKDDIRTKH